MNHLRSQTIRKSSNRPALFLLFFVSGFCGLLYQVIWTRMAFASFGVIPPVVSVVISVFMLGLALGSWAGGRWIGLLVEKTGVAAMSCYALTEFCIGLGAFLVPRLFDIGQRALFGAGTMDSARYLVLSALVLGFSILPWCILMGTTFPFMLAYIRKQDAAQTSGFSFLYVANVLGAMSGTLLTALVMIEYFGFRDTLRIAAAGNFLICLSAFLLGRSAEEPLDAEGSVTKSALLQTSQEKAPVQPVHKEGTHNAGNAAPALPGASALWILFWTGFAAMAMEVVWYRYFGPVLKTQVYSFAWVVATYLAATFVGSLWYRRHLQKGKAVSDAGLLGLACVTVFLPVLCNDVRLVKANDMWYADMRSAVVLLASIAPFCGVLGYLTPKLVDGYGGGSPAAAGRAYAINVLGCILGPLFASYLLLPRLSEHYALLLLAAPFVGFLLFHGKSLVSRIKMALGLTAFAELSIALFVSTSYEEKILRTRPEAIVRRDYAASVLSYGEGLNKYLLVNGMGMTTLTPITKVMVHLPLALRKQPAKSALIICFGMGTSFRAALSWDLETTAVELVPSVKEAFPFYHADASAHLANPQARIVIDDGRRFLARTRERYDLIVVDPPPPPEAAGSSLLYSKEFYRLAREHLNPEGILQAWVPKAGGPIAIAALRSMRESFPYVRCIKSLNRYGLHLLGSMQPIDRCTPAEMAARLPTAAARDLLEWNLTPDLESYLKRVLAPDIPVDAVLQQKNEIRITDDQPYNEYFLLRQLGAL
jgi:spermidine synthase